MSRINKKPNGIEENMVLRYLEENASDELVNKINGCSHELRDCWKYIVEQAKRMAQNGCAMIEDSVVFGWAVHYYEELGNVVPDAKAEVVNIAPIRKAETKKEEPKPKKTKEIDGQMDIFQFLGGEA